MAQDRQKEWAELATRGIVSGRERARARRELLDHMEDHMDSFLALGYTEEDALAHTLLAMGDPSLTAKLLRRAHQPILTWVLRVCRVAVLALALWTGICLAVTGTGWFGNLAPTTERIWSQQPYGKERTVYHPADRVRVGDYTLSAEGVAVTRQKDGIYQVEVLLEWKGDHIWQPSPRLRGTMTARCGAEEVTVEGNQPVRRLGRHYNLCRFRLRQKPERLTLEYTREATAFGLSVELTGGTVYESKP